MIGFSCLRVLVATALLGAAACDRAPESRKDTAPGPSATADPAELRERALSSALASVRSRLPLAAPPWRLQPLATGRHLLVRTKEDKVEAYRTEDFKLAFEKPLGGPRGAVELAGGSVAVVGKDETLRIDPGANKAVALPPFVFMPGTELLAERRDPGVLLIVERATRSVLKQPLSRAADAGRGESLPLDEYDGGPIAVMRDGALLYRGSGGVRRAMPGGRPRSLPTEFVPWRLLPGRRVDQAWAVAEDGAVELWLVGERLLVQAKFSLSAPPFDVAASSEYFGAVTIEEGAGKARVFRLSVFTNEGERVLAVELPAGPPVEGEGWAARAVRDRHLVLGETEPFVAVGGAGALRVLRLPEGAVLLER